jgi:hypothetical protein
MKQTIGWNLKTLGAFLLFAAFIVDHSSFSRAGVPAPMFIFYGEARDVYGWPIQSGAKVVARQGTNECASCNINGMFYPGVNFSLPLYLQDTHTNVNYSPKAVTPGSTVQILLIQGGVTQSLLEGSSYVVGDPARSRNITISAGTDADHDGLSDDWELELIAYLNNPLYRTIWDIHPGADLDGDLVSNADEFAAGTFAFLGEDYFYIEYCHRAAGRLGMEFLSVPGKAYSVGESSNLVAGVWRTPNYASSSNGVMQSGPFSGNGDWMQVYLDPTNWVRAARLQVKP